MTKDLTSTSESGHPSIKNPNLSESGPVQLPLYVKGRKKKFATKAERDELAKKAELCHQQADDRSIAPQPSEVNLDFLEKKRQVLKKKQELLNRSHLQSRLNITHQSKVNKESVRDNPSVYVGDYNQLLEDSKTKEHQYKTTFSASPSLTSYNLNVQSENVENKDFNKNIALQPKLQRSQYYEKPFEKSSKEESSIREFFYRLICCNSFCSLTLYILVIFFVAVFAFTLYKVVTVFNVPKPKHQVHKHKHNNESNNQLKNFYASKFDQFRPFPGYINELPQLIMNISSIVKNEDVKNVDKNFSQTKKTIIPKVQILNISKEQTVVLKPATAPSLVSSTTTTTATTTTTTTTTTEATTKQTTTPPTPKPLPTSTTTKIKPTTKRTTTEKPPFTKSTTSSTTLATTTMETSTIKVPTLKTLITIKPPMYQSTFSNFLQYPVWNGQTWIWSKKPVFDTKTAMPIYNQNPIWNGFNWVYTTESSFKRNEIPSSQVSEFSYLKPIDYLDEVYTTIKPLTASLFSSYIGQLSPSRNYNDLDTSDIIEVNEGKNYLKHYVQKDPYPSRPPFDSIENLYRNPNPEEVKPNFLRLNRIKMVPTAIHDNMEPTPIHDDNEDDIDNLISAKHNRISININLTNATIKPTHDNFDDNQNADKRQRDRHRQHHRINLSSKKKRERKHKLKPRKKNKKKKYENKEKKSSSFILLQHTTTTTEKPTSTKRQTTTTSTTTSTTPLQTTPSADKTNFLHPDASISPLNMLDIKLNYPEKLLWDQDHHSFISANDLKNVDNYHYKNDGLIETQKHGILDEAFGKHENSEKSQFDLPRELLDQNVNNNNKLNLIEDQVGQSYESLEKTPTQSYSAETEENRLSDEILDSDGKKYASTFLEEKPTRRRYSLLDLFHRHRKMNKEPQHITNGQQKDLLEALNNFENNHHKQSKDNNDNNNNGGEAKIDLELLRDKDNSNDDKKTQHTLSKDTGENSEDGKENFQELKSKINEDNDYDDGEENNDGNVDSDSNDIKKRKTHLKKEFGDSNNIYKKNNDYSKEHDDNDEDNIKDKNNDRDDNDYSKDHDDNDEDNIKDKNEDNDYDFEKQNNKDETPALKQKMKPSNIFDRPTKKLSYLQKIKALKKQLHANNKNHQSHTTRLSKPFIFHSKPAVLPKNANDKKRKRTRHKTNIRKKKLIHQDKKSGLINKIKGKEKTEDAYKFVFKNNSKKKHEINKPFHRFDRSMLLSRITQKLKEIDKYKQPNKKIETFKVKNCIIIKTFKYGTVVKIIKGPLKKKDIIFYTIRTCERKHGSFNKIKCTDINYELNTGRLSIKQERKGGKKVFSINACKEEGLTNKVQHKVTNKELKEIKDEKEESGSGSASGEEGKDWLSFQYTQTTKKITPPPAKKVVLNIEVKKVLTNKVHSTAKVKNILTNKVNKITSNGKKKSKHERETLNKKEKKSVPPITFTSTTTSSPNKITTTTDLIDLVKIMATFKNNILKETKAQKENELINTIKNIMEINNIKSNNDDHNDHDPAKKDTVPQLIDQKMPQLEDVSSNHSTLVEDHNLISNTVLKEVEPTTVHLKDISEIHPTSTPTSKYQDDKKTDYDNFDEEFQKISEGNINERAGYRKIGNFAKHEISQVLNNAMEPNEYQLNEQKILDEQKISDDYSGNDDYYTKGEDEEGNMIMSRFKGKTNVYPQKTLKKFSSKNLNHKHNPNHAYDLNYEYDSNRKYKLNHKSNSKYENNVDKTENDIEESEYDTTHNINHKIKNEEEDHSEDEDTYFNNRQKQKGKHNLRHSHKVHKHKLLKVKSNHNFNTHYHEKNKLKLLKHHHEYNIKQGKYDSAKYKDYDDVNYEKHGDDKHKKKSVMKRKEEGKKDFEHNRVNHQSKHLRKRKDQFYNHQHTKIHRHNKYDQKKVLPSYNVGESGDDSDESGEEKYSRSHIHYRRKKENYKKKFSHQNGNVFKKDGIPRPLGTNGMLGAEIDNVDIMKQQKLESLNIESIVAKILPAVVKSVSANYTVKTTSTPPIVLLPTTIPIKKTPTINPVRTIHHTTPKIKYLKTLHPFQTNHVKISKKPTVFPSKKQTGSPFKPKTTQSSTHNIAKVHPTNMENLNMIIKGLKALGISKDIFEEKRGKVPTKAPFVSPHRTTTVHPHVIALHDPKRIRILCFGDSLTAGYNNHGKGFFPYCTPLQKILNVKSSIPVYTEAKGIVGEMTHKQMVSRLPLVLGNATYEYDWVIILGGTNDILHVKNFADDQEFMSQLENVWQPRITKDIEKLHQIAYNSGAHTLLLTVPENSIEAWPDYKPLLKMRQKINESLRKFAQNSNGKTVLCDIDKKMPRHALGPEQESKLWDDHLHMTPEGYTKMANIIADCLKPYLPH